MEPIRHECGIAMIRLRKPQAYYKEKYGDSSFGLDKLYLLMEKEYNRGQEGAGAGCMAIRSGEMRRVRAEGADALHEIFRKIKREREAGETGFSGECYIGHLRYSTTGRSGPDHVHPFIYKGEKREESLMLCGNFNLTNIEPSGERGAQKADTAILLEEIAHAIKREGGAEKALRYLAPDWDGGYVLAGVTGRGEMWVMRDPHGIRPAYYHIDGEVIVAASERAAIQTVFNIEEQDVKELPRGHCLLVDENGEASLIQIMEQESESACSFERIYFSRGTDSSIYRERKELGRLLAPAVMRSIGGDIDNTVFSFIPNTAEPAYYGLTEAVEEILDSEKTEAALQAGGDREALKKIIGRRVRREMAAVKDVTLRTFIAGEGRRDDLAEHVYDITYGTLRRGKDNLVVVDDSVVRGTTLSRSIISMLDRLGPVKIVVASSSPQVRYPDCYGIDIPHLEELVAFRGAIELLKERKREDIIDAVYSRCKELQREGRDDTENCVRGIYEPFTDEEISSKISEMLTPEETGAKVEIVFQTIDDAHKAIPRHSGDWYFSGVYPTPGGYRTVNRSFTDYYENRRGMPEPQS